MTQIEQGLDWTVEEWQGALSRAWPDRDGQLSAPEAKFVSGVFALLRAMEQADSATDRRRISRRLRQLIRSRPDIAEEVFRVSADDDTTDGDTTGDAEWDGYEADVVTDPAPARANRFLTVPVWYATDRTPTKSAKPHLRYNETASGSLHVGKAEVTIPDLHKKGQLERPGKFLWLFELREDPERHVTLRTVTPMADEEWMSDLQATVRRGPRADTTRDILVYIHGYNTTWQDSLLRAAQLARDVEFQGPVLAYSWSSKGNPILYTADIEAVADTSPVLEELLTRLLRDSGAARVHVVAHSMGNRAIISALREVSREKFPKTAAELREVVFAAPDVGTRVFTDFVGDYFSSLHTSFNRKSGIASRFTLYACGDDYALGLSKFVGQMTRAGDPRQQRVIVPPLETIDVTEAIVSADTHAYFVSNRDVLTDLFGVVRGRAPGQRPGLDPIPQDAPEYWAMRA